MAPQQQQQDSGRDRVSNPNYHSPPPFSSSTSSYAPPPSVPQPPPRQPHFDPFRGRDPFLPAASADKRDARSSESILGDVLHHAPAPLQSSYHHSPASLIPFKDDHNRPKSSMHGAPYDHHSPPAPPLPVSSAPPLSSSSSSSGLFGRQMPPPTSAGSPVGSAGRPHGGPHSPPHILAYGSSRESNNGPTKHRSNSSMSIQSMMAQDAAPLPISTAHAGLSRAWSPPAHTAAGSNTYPRPLSPLRDTHQSRGLRTPERRYDGAASQGYQQPPSLPPPPPPPLPSAHHSSAHSPNHYSSAQAHSPDSKRNSISHLTQPVQFTSQSNSAPPPRPYSQPAGADTLLRPEERHRNGHAASSRPLDPYERPSSQHQSSSAPFDRTGSRDRALSDQDARADPYSRDAYSSARPFSRPPTTERKFAPIGQSTRTESAEPRYGQIWKDRPLQPPLPPQQQSSRDSFYPRPNENVPADSHSPLKRLQLASSSQTPFDSTRFPASSSQHSELNALTGSTANAGPIAPPANGGAADPSARLTPGRLSSYQSRVPNIDSQLRKSIEENQAPNRAILSLGGDFVRRVDRGSPLPQAVQGAQAQPAGSGRDPSIKSEFGRMFSGLGSGIGSTPQPLTSNPHGHPSSGRQSPLGGEDMVESESLHRRLHDGEAMRGGGTSSRGGRRGKRNFEEDLRMDSISPEGRVTPVGALGRAGKKSKTNHPGQLLHHHHHHSLAHHHHNHHHHHHHHHHHKQDEEASAPFMARRMSGTLLNPARASSNAQSNGTLVNATAPAPPHHHHYSTVSAAHHHHPPHHHHHPPPAAPVRSQPIHRPMTTIHTNDLLKSLSSLPRRHLGSHLYAPTVATPPSHTFSLGSTHMFSTKPNPLPRFSRENHSNCTLTVRVPRYYLSQHSREAICADRRLWGTDVYTDDSDPVAAAIHGGWVRGAWGEDIDVALLLELGGASNGSNTNDGGNKGTSEPADEDTAAQPEIHSEKTQAGRDTSNGICREEETGETLAGREAAINGKSKSRDKEERVQQSRRTVREINTPPPSGPPNPPENADLHITLLMTPPLEKYSSSVWHGVKSRSWGDNHDGMSFKILKLEYISEGIDSRNKERHHKSSSYGSHISSSNSHERVKDYARLTAAENEAGRPFGNTSRAVGTIGMKMHRKAAGLLKGSSSSSFSVGKARLTRIKPVSTKMASGPGKVAA